MRRPADIPIASAFSCKKRMIRAPFLQPAASGCGLGTGTHSQTIFFALPVERYINCCFRYSLFFETTDKCTMEKRINYEDNTFIINTRIRLLHDILLLEADSSLFFKKMLEELDFINETLDVLLNALVSNNSLIGRSGRFHDLMETEWRFTALLNFLIEGGGSLGDCFHPQFSPKLVSIRSDCGRRRDLIKEHNLSSPEADEADERLVSTLELAELLRGQ
jgi:hypothetical protein